MNKWTVYPLLPVPKGVFSCGAEAGVTGSPPTLSTSPSSELMRIVIWTRPLVPPGWAEPTQTPHHQVPETVSCDPDTTDTTKAGWNTDTASSVGTHAQDGTPFCQESSFTP